MNLQLILTARFKKSIKLMSKRGYNLKLIEEIILKLQKNVPLEAKYHNHELKGKLNGYKECHIQADWLLIYMIDYTSNSIVLIDTGTHADLFSM